MSACSEPTIRPLEIDDYDAVFALWQETDGMGLSSADSREAIAAYLERNPGWSLVALDEAGVAGTVLCGHDGRRGFLHHLAVREDQRGRGLARRLVEHSLQALARAGIEKCHVYTYGTNEAGIAFWQRIGWEARDELRLLSRTTGVG